MVIYIGADHRGFELKKELKEFLGDNGYEVYDVGNIQHDPDDDYPDFALEVAKRVSKEYETSRGILICGSGVGMDVVANRFPGVRSALAASSDQAFDSRNDDDANVLCLAANYLKPADAKKIVSTWLSTDFVDEEKYRRRLGKICEIELMLKKQGCKDIRGDADFNS